MCDDERNEQDVENFYKLVGLDAYPKPPEETFAVLIWLQRKAEQTSVLSDPLVQAQYMERTDPALSYDGSR